MDKEIIQAPSLADMEDTPALLRLSDALWGRMGGGAAVLIGAGFSRLCERPHIDSPLPPIWTNLAEAMASGLGRTRQEALDADPLRLAETYETAFGRGALVELIRREVNDAAWRPGVGHATLLDLPWSDVLTTNYDTLLERAREVSIRGYGVVRREGDLSGSRAPRIIKLHGTIEDDTGLVITEEDYRRYPEMQAAMFNTARQALIENDLCLLGFSGNDPNFRAWVGWVRDRLRGLQRRVYLVGLLDLSPIDRRVLERLGVIPIDLSQIVPENVRDRHRAANEWLLKFLAQRAPKVPADWKPLSAAELGHPSRLDEQQKIEKDHALLADNLREAVRGWRRDRQGYPGWLVCPAAKRYRLRFGTDAPLRLNEALNVMKADEAANALLEMAWRHDTASDPLPPWVARRLDEIAPSLTAATDPELLRAAVSSRLRAAREKDEELETVIQRWSHLANDAEVAAHIAYARALEAMDRIDFATITGLLPELRGEDSVWHLRRAAILAWLGEEEDARKTVQAAWIELLDRCRRMPLSIPLQSRLTWTHLIADVIRDVLASEERLELPRRFRIEDYEPWDEIRHIDKKLEETEHKSREEASVEVQFRAGRYRTPGGLHFVSRAAALTPASELAWLRERVGLPFGVKGVSLLHTRTERAIVASEELSLTCISRALSAHPSTKGPLLNRWLTRIGVAALEDDIARKLAKRCEGAIKYWLERMGSSDERWFVACDRLQILIETLARLAVRSVPGDALRQAQLALEIAKIGEGGAWHRLSSETDHLIENAVDAMPRDARWHALAIVVHYPVPGERDDHTRNLSRLYASFTGAMTRPERITDRITELLSMLPAEDRRRAGAIHLLFVLYRIGILTTDEAEHFRDGLWMDALDKGLPHRTELYPDAFLDAPAPTQINVQERLKATLYSGDLVSKAEFVGRALDPTPMRLSPSSGEARHIFNVLATWRPEPLPDQDPVIRTLTEKNLKQKRDLDLKNVATALGYVCWHLGEADRTPERADAIMTFVSNTGGQAALIGSLVFEDRSDLIRALRRLASSGNYEETLIFVRALAIAVKRASPIPAELIGTAITATAHQPPSAIYVLLQLMENLVEADRVDAEDISVLENVLDDLWTRLGYASLANSNTSTQTLISASFTRATAVRLADMLSKKGVTGEVVDKWSSCIATDPLPEVRHALIDN